MNLKFVFSLVFSLGLFAGLSTAQDSQPGQLLEIQQMEVQPEQIGTFVQIAVEIAEIAKASKLPAKHSFHFWSAGNDFYVASPHANFAALDSPNAWLDALGEEGKQKVMAAFERLEKEVTMRPVARNFIRENPEWGYQPAEPMPYTAGTLYKFWVKSDQWEAFDAMIDTWQELWKAIDFPYAAAAYQPQTGEGGTVEVMIFHDGLANYMGVNSAGALARKAGKQELRQKAQQELNSCINDLEMTHMTFHPNMSYSGPATMASNR